MNAMADTQTEGPQTDGTSMNEPAPTTYDLVICAALLPAEPEGDHAMWRVRVAGAFDAMTRAGGGRCAWVGRTELVGDRPVRIGEAWLHPLPMSEQDIQEYARGYCASTLSPVYHGVD